jgi:hypothetical protein
LSALSAVNAGQGLAGGILKGTPVWMGGIEGLKITRDGLPSPDPDVSCSAVMTPQLDSAAAIAAAFPNDPATKVPLQRVQGNSTS